MQLFEADGPSLTLDGDSVVKTVPGKEDVHPTLKPEELALLQLASPDATVSDILLASGMAGSVTMRTLRDLYERGLLSVTGAQKPVGREGQTQDLSEFVGQIAEARRAGKTPHTTGSEVKGTATAAPRRIDKTLLQRPALGRAQPPVRPKSGFATEAVEAGQGDHDDGTTRVGAYEVVARIAQGGVGSIYLCRRVGGAQFQRLYALKVIREHAGMTTASAARSLLREAHIATLLRHPHVVPVVDVGHDRGQPFLLMDYVEGTSLAKLAPEGTSCEPALIVPVMIDVLRGLQRAHELTDEGGRFLGLVHGDLSPHNVMVGTDGAARLTDFGSARFTAIAGDRQVDAETATPAFMAPEQAMGDPIDVRTDVFAAGIILWSALTGHRLFGAGSYDQTLANVLRKPVLPPSSFGVAASLDEICLRALSRKPADRFQSIQEMTVALVAVGAREGFLPGDAAVGRWARDAIADVLKERQKRLSDLASGVTSAVVISAQGFEPPAGSEERNERQRPVHGTTEAPGEALVNGGDEAEAPVSLAAPEPPQPEGQRATVLMDHVVARPKGKSGRHDESGERDANGMRTQLLLDETEDTLRGPIEVVLLKLGRLIAGIFVAPPSKKETQRRGKRPAGRRPGKNRRPVY